MPASEHKLVVFKGKNIRRTLYQNEWWFVVVENKDAAQRGGKIAGDAREKLEIESGRRVVSKENYLSERPQRKRRAYLQHTANI